jgi:hypothetical protein
VPTRVTMFDVSYFPPNSPPDERASPRARAWLGLHALRFALVSNQGPGVNEGLNNYRLNAD